MDEEEPVPKQRSDILELMLSKANASRKIHSPSKIRIRKRPLSDWLSRSSWRTRREFINAFADASPWVKRSNSAESLLIRELSWSGKMFGAFTHSEVERLKLWIDSLPTPEEKAAQSYYWTVIGRERHHLNCSNAAELLAAASWDFLERCGDIASHHPVLVSRATDLPRSCENIHTSIGKSAFVSQSSFEVSDQQLSALLSIWFAHTSLLEKTVNVPYRTSSSLYSQIVLILRAESGFMPETSGVAGLDEQVRSGYWPSILDLGLELVSKLGYQTSDFAGLKDVLERDILQEQEFQSGEQCERRLEAATNANKLAYSMLHLSLRPIKNLGLLLGLSRAFLDLEAGVAKAEALLSSESRKALQRLVERKHRCFSVSLDLIKVDESLYRDFCQGYVQGRAKIGACLVTNN